MQLRRFAKVLMVSIATLAVPPLLVVTMASATTPSASQSLNPYRQLDIREGRWTYSGQSFETPYSHARTSFGIDDCTWMPGKVYMVCGIMSTSNPPDPNALSVFSYNRTAGTYTHVVSSDDSKPLWETVTVRGDTWLAQAQIPNGGKTILLRDLYTFLSPDRMTERVTLSVDQGRHWIVRWQSTEVKAH